MISLPLQRLESRLWIHLDAPRAPLLLSGGGSQCGLPGALILVAAAYLLYRMNHLIQDQGQQRHLLC